MSTKASGDCLLCCLLMEAPGSGRLSWLMRSALFSVPAVVPSLSFLRHQSAPRSSSYNALCMRHGEFTS